MSRNASAVVGCEECGWSTLDTSTVVGCDHVVVVVVVVSVPSVWLSRPHVSHPEVVRHHRQGGQPEHGRRQEQRR